MKVDHIIQKAFVREDNNRYIRKVLKEIVCDDISDVIWFYDEEKDQFRASINCNDVFFWGTADLEVIKDEKDVEEIVDITKEIQNTIYADIVWACRKRKMRPQKGFYKHIPERIRPFIDQCGPERKD